jgi:EAL and modified HD-GYP domain-containing signal transduction protein
VVARRPLIDRSGAIAGWDLRPSAWATERVRRSAAARSLLDAIDFALLQAARATAPRAILITLPARAARDAAFTAQLPAGTMVALEGTAIERLDAELPSLIERLHKQGLKLALPAAAGTSADFQLLDAPTLATLDERAGARAAIATDLRSFEEFAAAMRRGVDYACGAYALASAPRAGNASAQTATVANIVSALLAGRASRDIAEMFKADVTLSYRLLRIVNSAAFGTGRELASAHDAVLMLGTRELYRWLCTLLLASGEPGPLTRALHETALTRGRLLERVAAARGVDSPEALFVTGAFSLLDLLLNVPLETALALMPLLPTQAIDALIAETGPWRPYLDLALALESGDDARLEAACEQLQLNREKAASLYAEAADWAAAASAASRE